jgi:hypothetical protein
VNILKFRILGLIIGLLFLTSARAGWADGPYVVWANYSQSPDEMNLIIKDLFNEHDSCIDYSRSPIFYMKIRPEGITNKLIYKALVDNNENAQADLYNLLVTYSGKSKWDENKTVFGLDGVVAYFPLPRPHLMSFSFNKETIKYKIKTRYIKSINQIDLIRNALCDVMPEITRD